MKRLLLAGKGKDAEYIELPESWDEVSFKKFLDLSESDNVDLKAISILTEKSELEWAASKNVNAYYACLDGVSKWFGKGLSELINREARTLKFLSQDINLADLGEESVAQYEDLKVLVAKYHTLYETDPIKAMRDYYPTMCAIYLQPKASGNKYNYGEAVKLIDQINQMPAPLVIGVTNFFLLKYVGSRTGITGSAPKANSLLKRWKQGLVSYLKRLVLKQHLTRLQRGVSKRKIILKG